jgi:lysophospholipase L1-like esterase
MTCRVGGAVVCFLILGAASCSTNQPPLHNGKPIIQFDGDSITVQATADINAHYGTAYDVGINALVGTDTYIEAGEIGVEAAESPKVEIINLGTNDATRVGKTLIGTYNGQPFVIEPAQTLADITGRFDTFATEFPASTCVIFVNVNTHNPSWGPANAQAIDDHLTANPTLFPHVVDWNAAWNASYFNTPDNPHPNETGRQALLALEDAAIASCPA